MDPAGQLLRRGADGGAEIGLMKLVPAFCRGGDECDPKTSSPIAEKVCETEARLFWSGLNCE